MQTSVGVILTLKLSFVKRRLIAVPIRTDSIEELNSSLDKGFLLTLGVLNRIDSDRLYFLSSEKDWCFATRMVRNSILLMRGYDTAIEGYLILG